MNARDFAELFLGILSTMLKYGYNVRMSNYDVIVIEHKLPPGPALFVSVDCHGIVRIHCPFHNSHPEKDIIVSIDMKDPRFSIELLCDHVKRSLDTEVHRRN